MENCNLIVFDFCFTYILISHYVTILYFHLPYFHVSNSSLFFLHCARIVLSFYIGVVFTLSLNGLYNIVNVPWQWFASASAHTCALLTPICTDSIYTVCILQPYLRPLCQYTTWILHGVYINPPRREESGSGSVKTQRNHAHLECSTFQ